jgi:PAS domain S-box-containing protein
VIFSCFERKLLLIIRDSIPIIQASSMVQGMVNAVRDSGIDVIGDVPWGTHFCLFYKADDDLSDIIVSFFRAGLMNNEFCMCVTSDPVNAGEMKRLMRAALPDFDDCMSRGQIEIIPYTEWYLIDGIFDHRRVIDGWNAKLRQARERGFVGARLTGNTFWLDKHIWKDFLEYEQAIDGAIAGRNIIVLCTYSLDRCDAGDILDVVSTHQFALTRRNGEWKIIEDQEHKKARKALLESEEKFKAVFEWAAMGIAISDPGGFIVDCNPAYQEMLGYSKEELREKRFMDITYPDDRERNRELQLQMAEGLIDKYQLEKRYIRKDGQLIWCMLTASAIRNSDGSLKYNMAVAKDITRHKQAEEALRESERRFRGIYEQAPLGIALVDSTTGRFLQINQKYCDIVGHTSDEMLATDFQSITHPDDLQEDLDNMARLLTGEIKSFNMEKRYFHANGSIVPVNLTVVPMWDEEESYKCHIAMVEDITNRKRVEESLHTTLQRFYSILSGMYPGILLVTEEDRVEFANQAFCDYFDLMESPGDLAGLASLEMIEKIKGDYQHPDREIARIREIISRGQPVRGEEVAMRNGRTCLRDFVPLNVEGQRYGRLWLHHDISERKQAEIKLEEAKAQAELYVDLMGHDINNMHQIALGYLEMARDMQADIGQTEFIDKPVEVLQRSARLIKNVRKLQNLREGAFQTGLVDVGKVLVDVQREFGEVPGKTITLNLNGRENCRVHTNELLRDVFANLVGNAIKHTGDHADIVVDLDVVEDDGGRYCRVMVEDDGPGIPDDFKGRIFNRMLKSTDKAKGMGLGLYLVKSLVESYGGRVWVGDRVLGDHTKGARFVVMLPIVEQ